jgi:thiosulfate dehydrogenase (quinone) large subunit
MAKRIVHRNVQISDSPIAKFIFSDTRMAWVWLIARLYMSYSWLTSGYGKLTNPAWANTGDALKGFWSGAVQTQPKPVITFDWYRQFIQFMLDSQAYVWFSKLVIAGELLVGTLLLLGAFTGIAAFIGGFMNWNFMMAGTASVNPVFFTLSVLLILAWRTAGYWGLDRFLLPLLGTPWKPALVIEGQEPLTSRSMAD